MDQDIVSSLNNEFDAKKFLAKRVFKKSDEETSTQVDDLKLNKEAEDAVKKAAGVSVKEETKPAEKKADAAKADDKAEEPAPAAAATIMLNKSQDPIVSD